MVARYLRDYAEELRRLGSAVFKVRHRSPFLVVVGKAGELVGDSMGMNQTIEAQRLPGIAEDVKLLNRVFPVLKQPSSPPGPVMLGRTGESDISIPEYSISKRHCQFEFERAGVKISDCGSTNGTCVGELPLASGSHAFLRGGEVLAIGRFALQFHTAPSFYALVKQTLG